MDIFLLPMAGANMVIGIQGMKTLGPIMFDFQSLNMSFYLEGKSVKWKGSPWISDDPFTVGQLKCLVASTKEAYLQSWRRRRKRMRMMPQSSNLNYLALYTLSVMTLPHLKACHPREKETTTFTLNQKLSPSMSDLIDIPNFRRLK